MTQVQLDWTAQLCNTLECYNMADEEGKGDPCCNNIPESEGKREVVGPDVQIPDVTQPVKMRQVNIGSEVQPKFACIRVYQDEDTIGKVIELLHQYHELFLTNFTVLKRIVDDERGEDTFVETEEVDSPFIVKRKKPSVRGVQKKHELEKSTGT